MTIKVFIAVGLLGLVFSLQSQDNTPKYSNEFLSLGVGGRAFAMSGAQTAIVSDVSASYWNPAGLIWVPSDQQLMLMHSIYYTGIGNYDYGAFTLALDDSSRLAFSIIRFSVDDIPDTRFLFDANGAINYNNIRFFSASDYAGLITYAKRLNRLGGVDVGANMKIVHRLVGDFSRAWGFGLDVGFQKRMGSWFLGLTGHDVFGTFNAWSHNADEFRDIFIQTGNEVPVNTLEITLPQWTFGVGRNFTLPASLNLLMTADLKTTFDGQRNTLLKTNLVSVDPVGGLELGFRQNYFIRYGIGQFQQVENLNGHARWRYRMSGGIGVVLRDFTLDYALTDFGTNAVGLYSHVFSVKINFHAKED